MHIGIIGTGWISRQFADAVQRQQGAQLAGVLSRTRDSAERFKLSGEAYPAYGDIEEFLADPRIDTVYIASPNSMHYSQAAKAIDAGKNVIVEKPAFSNPAEFAKIEMLLQRHPRVRFFEAARHIHTDAFRSIAQQVGNMGAISGAVLSYMKYSSKYDAFLAGETPNIFTARFSGGALQDLGVYLAYDAIALFGAPLAAQYHPLLLSTGTDAMGTGVLHYQHFDATLLISKTVNSRFGSEIYAGRQTLSFDNGGDLGSVRLVEGDGTVQEICRSATGNPMSEEVRDFTEVIQAPDEPANQSRYLRWLRQSREVCATLWQMRQSAGIHSPADDSGQLTNAAER
ncbi:Gfo/Idh/MocA family protein [Bifidobacterium subtile]|jgi:predicted dehydrogenase|uniref:Oxidoreductase n=1 Tax=Bifidobacterium subtile TaxID=77635 RepID=A0A087EBY9_9BIFI|nr:Gfo/Idh/MocA family oxidoreductase [Bifidobacterium subtile]KFJ05290.1 oxidoreductase [Bifidobacterium subtile]QOL36679.1 Gfo/Idh/MocA family oxidoreductase [Bifidobacterium subtile]